MPSFSKSKGSEIWVLLLEKAYAKIFGCYERIESGNESHAFNDLTGATSKSYIFLLYFSI